MVSRGAKWAEARQLVTGLALLCLACVGTANLLCAVRYGAVFMVRGSSDWAYLDVAPLSFFLSVAASVILTPFCASLGVMAIKGVRNERNFRKNLPFQPRYEDTEHTFSTRL